MWGNTVATGGGSRDSGDSRGQSEVIGTILIVAIAVVLAAVIGQYVFGIDIVQGGQQSVGPQIAFDTEVQPSSGDLVIRHQSGDSVETSTLKIVGSESSTPILTSSELESQVKAEWTASESITIDSSDLTSGETIRIIWESSTTSDSTVVLKFEYQP